MALRHDKFSCSSDISNYIFQYLNPRYCDALIDFNKILWQDFMIYIHPNKYILQVDSLRAAPRSFLFEGVLW